jgi:hypothetical protein
VTPTIELTGWTLGTNGVAIGPRIRREVAPCPGW